MAPGMSGFVRALGQPAVAPLARPGAGPPATSRRPRSAARRACTGRGCCPKLPPHQPNSSAHAARMPSMASSVSRPRSANGHAEHVELGLDVAGADAEDDPAAGQLVERGERLGRRERVAVGGDVDVAEAAGCVVVMPASQPRVATVSYQTVLIAAALLGGDGDVVADGDVVEAGVVAGPGDGGELVTPGGRPPTARRSTSIATAPAAACRTAPGSPTSDRI